MKKSMLNAAVLATVFATSAVAADWLPLPATGYWQHLLHLGANFQDDMLTSAWGGVDPFETHGYGSQTNQFPYPGLALNFPDSAVHGAHNGHGASATQLVWTVMDNENKNNGWWSVGGDYPNYVKYWHVYIFLPGEEEREVLVWTRHDDGMWVWNNGVLIFENTQYNGGDDTALATLYPGVNSITIKLRQDGGGEHMAIRLTYPNWGDMHDLFYGFSLENRAPEVVSFGLDTATLSLPYVNETEGAAEVVTVLDTEDRGDKLSLWLASASCASNVQSVAESASPAQAVFSNLAQDTPYAARYFVADASGETPSGVARFTTYGTVPVVRMLSVSAPGLGSVSARVFLEWPGATPDASLTLYWGTADAGPNSALWESNNPGKSVVFNGCAAGEHTIPFFVPAANTPYYCRVFATSGGVSAAAPTSLLFMVETLRASELGTLYWGGGSRDIPPLTPIPVGSALALNGVWDKKTKNWSIDPEGSQYVAWEDGDHMVAVFTTRAAAEPVVKLADNVALNVLVMDMQGVAGWNAFQITADDAFQIKLHGLKPEVRTLPGPNADSSYLALTRAVQLSAPDGFFKSGAGELRVHTPTGLAKGTVIVDGYGLRVQDAAGFTGSMLGVSEFAIRDSGQFFSFLTGEPNDRIHDGAAVRLSGNGVFIPHGSGDGTETFRQLKLDAHGRVGEMNASRGVHTLNDLAAGIDRGSWQNGTLLLEGADASGNEALSPNLVVQNGLPNTGELLPWIYTHRANPVRLNPATKTFEAMPVETADNDVTLWEAGKDYRVEDALSNTLSNLSVNSLGFYSVSGNPVLNIEDGHTLDIASGLLTLNRQANRISGGSLTSSSGKLHASSCGAWWQMTSVIESALTGNMDFIKSGTGIVLLQGNATNDFKGTTHVNSGTLWMDKAHPQALPGDLVIHKHAAVEFFPWPIYNNWQTFDTNANYTIRDSGVFSLSSEGVVQDFNGVMRIENGRFYYHSGSSYYGPGTTFAHPGTGLVFNNGGLVSYVHDRYANYLHLLTDIRCEPGASNQVVLTSIHQHHVACAVLSDNASPFVVPRVWEVNAGAGLLPGVPEMTVGLLMASSEYSDACLVKTGDGALALERVSGLYFGTAEVLDGSLLLNAYATQTVATVTGGSWTTVLEGFPSTAGLHPGQSLNHVSNSRPYGWIQNIYDENSLSFPAWIWFPGDAWNDPEEFDITFFASGPLGWADVAVGGGAPGKLGVLGGTGGHAGNVFVKTGGALRAGTPAKRFSEFHIGGNNGFDGSPGEVGNLDFSGGGLWQVDLDATSETCSVVHVSGDITLANGAVEPIFHNAVKPRPKGTWTIATFGGEVIGKMSAPQGCKVRVDEANKIVQFVSSEAGTLLMVR